MKLDITEELFGKLYPFIINDNITDIKCNVYDIIYSPEITPMMSRAIASGCHVSNGYSMLRHQGYKQFKLFTGEEYGDDTN